MGWDRPSQQPFMMEELRGTLTRFALDPKNHDFLSVLKGARNGLVYGAKIRAPHALVMVFLFGSGTPMEKLRKILTATRQHSMRLGAFVAIYKSLVLAQRKWLHGGKEDTLDTFIAGLVGGWYMFGERTPVNEQIVLYCAARCLASLLPRAPVPDNYPPNKVIPIDNTAHQIFAALTWGSVMWLFQNRRQFLNGGLVNSMDCMWCGSGVRSGTDAARRSLRVLGQVGQVGTHCGSSDDRRLGAAQPALLSAGRPLPCRVAPEERLLTATQPAKPVLAQCVDSQLS